MEGYKAFDKNMKCRGYQFEEGQTYEAEEAIICKRGFHFCANPFDVLNYYSIVDSEFHEVESLPDAQTDTHNEDSKVSTTKIKIGAKLGLKGFIEASVNFLVEKCRDRGGKNASGDSARIELNGQHGVGMAAGFESKIKGKKGNWITLAEWIEDEEKRAWIPVCVKSAQIDGESLKEDTWYALRNGEFVEVNK